VGYLLHPIIGCFVSIPYLYVASMWEVEGRREGGKAGLITTPVQYARLGRMALSYFSYLTFRDRRVSGLMMV
jgi:hypothetical protein